MFIEANGGQQQDSGDFHFGGLEQKQLPISTVATAPTWDGPDLSTGDFAFMPHEHVAHVINYAAQLQWIASEQPQNRATIKTRVGLLKANLTRVDAYTQNPANYTKGARETISDKLGKDAENPDPRTNLSRARERLRRFSGRPIIISDLDGSMTTNPGDYLRPYIPGSRQAEDLLEVLTRERFVEVFAGTWQPLLKQCPRLFKVVANKVKIREGVSDTIEFARANELKFAVLSANFMPFVLGTLERIPGAEDILTIAVTPETTIADEKYLALRHLALSNPDRPLIYIGDGTSDIKAITPEVAVFFGLEDASFAEVLKERGLTYFTYSSYHDVTQTLSQILPRSS